MKTLFRKLISTALAAALVAAPLYAAASEALGHDLFTTSTALNRRTELATGTFWSDSQSDLREENYIVYTPNPSVTPIVTYITPVLLLFLVELVLFALLAFAVFFLGFCALLTLRLPLAPKRLKSCIL